MEKLGWKLKKPKVENFLGKRVFGAWQIPMTSLLPEERGQSQERRSLQRPIKRPVSTSLCGAQAYGFYSHHDKFKGKDYGCQGLARRRAGVRKTLASQFVGAKEV
jgi:hypothetical protein